MNASYLIKELEKAIEKNGNLEICVVYPTGVTRSFSVLAKNDYVAFGEVLFSEDEDSLCENICIDCD